MLTGDELPDRPVLCIDYVLAVIDDRDDAEQAREDLRQNGFARDDVFLSAPAHPGAGALRRKQGTLADAPGAVRRVFAEEGLDQEQYASERAHGRTIVHVCASRTNDIERARAILVAHSAHTIKRVGRWTRENLPEA
jgi:hypothetical protein